jgi:AraC-like DNA-binding protein
MCRVKNTVTRRKKLGANRLLDRYNLAFQQEIGIFTPVINDNGIVFMGKYKHIRPVDVYISSEQWFAIMDDRRNGIPHPEITTIRLTGNNFFDLFAGLVEAGVGLNMKNMAAAMGVKPVLFSPAIEAMSGLTAHRWVVRYLHLSACDKLSLDGRNISELAAKLGFRTVSGFSHFFYRLEHCHPTQFAAKRSCRVLR